ncbi:DUF6159 family protein [Arenimonas caeni]|jgi:hypothetical protein|uniref:Glycerophosphoryl diester phosphodiesterase membrane domain-containing protein n=1 Tax=Arenimonas caeni TaxID=2058085 RepID=A0A2P6M8N2_9GAMM|nr:DUF6159 family protein [Arenimonas caeni]MDY0021408.1 DUF6159 family protein [Arenimonas caeni]PRH82353.1 hypothetical protein C6N40_07490 [Arenimonas caeni]
MFDKLSRSWHLVKASAGVLRSDKELLVFPVISAVASLVVAATFLLPMFGAGLLEGDDVGPVTGVLLFLFYLCQYFVIFFFNTALVGAAMIRLEGGDPTVADGLRIARSKFMAILGYAAIAATVGLILRSLQERAGFLGRIVVGLLGMAWTFATFLVVPILVSRDVGPIDALKESVTLLKRTWGENLAGNVGINLAFGLLTTAVVILGIALVVGAAMVGGATLALVVAAFAVVAVAFVAVVQAALSGIYSAAVYRYAVDGQAPEGFSGGELQDAFRQK